MPSNLDDIYLCYIRATLPCWFPSVPVYVLLSYHIAFFSSSAPKIRPLILSEMMPQDLFADVDKNLAVGSGRDWAKGQTD
jgi:hypothetical protein